MKKIIAILLLLSAINISGIAAQSTSNSDEPTRIEMDINNQTSDEAERSIANSVIEAIFNSSNQQVEVTLYNIGEAEVYIMNSQNQVISSSIIDTDSPVVVNLVVTGGQGTYYIVVMSEKWYAEGQFTL